MLSLSTDRSIIDCLLEKFRFNLLIRWSSEADWSFVLYKLRLKFGNASPNWNDSLEKEKENEKPHASTMLPLELGVRVGRLLGEHRADLVEVLHGRD